ncbi:MAG: hypothetical protein MJ192_05985 [Clostridia bacterium]|nr:hypothetical protein [Clostridia bacterium]
MAKKSIVGTFNGLPRILQIILLLIPVTGWIVELLVRWSSFIQSKSIITLIFAIGVTIFGWGFCIIDAIWCLLFKHLIFA